MIKAISRRYVGHHFDRNLHLQLEFGKLRGYAEQLRIIADELQQAEDRRKRKDRVVGGVFSEPGRQS